MNRAIMFAIGLVTALASGAPLLPGVIDTVGGTTYDNQNSGPALRWVISDPQYGVHVSWMHSAQPSNWPDRTMRYNYRERTSTQWNWPDPDFMAAGTNSQYRRSGFGTSDINPNDGGVVIACHYSSGMMQFTPTCVHDIAPGQGIFEEMIGDPNLVGYFLAVVGVTQNQTIHLLIIAFQASINLYYSRWISADGWEPPTSWDQDGAFGHNLVASHVSNKVLATWMTGHNEELKLHYRFSSDGGTTWDGVEDLTPPAAYGMDTTTVCYTGANAIFDRDDNWQLVTTLAPVYNDSAYMNPAQLWHYNSLTVEWHQIHRAEASLAGELGPNATICGRPNLSQNPTTGRLFVAWEQFDSLNLEPTTNQLRADIWIASSPDGATWSSPSRLTEADETSKRFPCLANNASGNSLSVGWLQDLVAGFNPDQVGAVTNNPICVWRGVWAGIAEESQKPQATGRMMQAVPNPFRTKTAISLRLAAGSPTELRILDVAGRAVRTFSLPSSLTPRASSLIWDGTDDAGNPVSPGCYLARWNVGKRYQQTRLTLLR